MNSPRSGISRRTTSILIAAAATEPDPAQLLVAVCKQAAKELGCIAVTVNCHTAASPIIPAAASHPLGEELDAVQDALGEGPHHELTKPDEFITCDALAEQRERWPLFSDAAVARNVGAVFVFPIAPDDALVGSLTLYRNAGRLTEADWAGAIEYAVAVSLILLHTDQVEPNGGVYNNPGAPRWIVVQQATGMVSVQLGMSLPDAHARLRARAYAMGVPLAELATDVVNRKLRFTKDDTFNDDAHADEAI